MNAEKLSSIISSYIPEEAVPIVVQWIRDYQIELTITGSRKSIYGNYQWPQKQHGHRISVNGDLNKYAFFITLVHEVAHLVTWQKYQNTVPSHGRQWKQEFKTLMNAFTGKKIFPPDITHAFRRHLTAPSFSHCVDEELMRALHKYDCTPDVHLESLPAGSLFRYDGHLFIKEVKMRKRIRCREQKSNREFLFNALTAVEPVA